MDYASNEHYLGALIKDLSDDRNATSYRGFFTITAVVNGTEKVSADRIDCMFIKHHDHVEVDVMWEDCGYKNYRDMGIYGLMRSQYFSIKNIYKNSFQLLDNNGSYELTFEW
ncbi:hypothetical protein CXF83_15130 [Shewanella sp. Choline-02u-19]|uniref:hypothetical protein n=1 Tax=unclassified Shewanella TaxID=196818 RepID=UPI000C323A8F|nr:MULTISPECIES: hypothetical protein [unclassified Shewanella]PKH56544.1 hypothetical protein CXF84_13215 [Shewanella sp. Bg11-22]PKI27950.1 hypothetical protein CXF83_15130 [Shewanella sp. Choline-02u-19]